MVCRSWRSQTERTPKGETKPALAQLVGHPHLAEGRLLQRKPDEDRLGVGRDAVLQDRLSPREFLQRQFPAGVIKLLEAIETVAAVAHHHAGLADVAELLRQLQQPDLDADDLLFGGHDGVLSNRRGGALRHPTAPRPASAIVVPRTGLAPSD